jgi:serine/threonine-protein kinase
MAGGTLRRGSVLAGKYRLEMLLGEGGMSFVWSAYHLDLQVPVALKLLKLGAKRHRLAERLRLEARVAARLSHPAIVRVFDTGTTEDGTPFIVLELLSGECLADVLGRGPLSAERAVQLLLPIAEALALAHRHGIVHRDLKPDNVFLAADGEQLQPKLLDFGIAKLRYASRLPQLTERGTALGSPSYMSPEQVRGDDVDFRSDVWSFCVMLYKAVSGKAPFRAEDKNALMDAILRDEPPPLTSICDVDAELAQLIHRGLSKDVAARPASMHQLGCELAQWLQRRGERNDACGMPLSAKWLRVEPSSDEQTAPHFSCFERRSLPRARRWALLTGAALLFVGASLAAPQPPARLATITPTTLPTLAPTPAPQPVVARPRETLPISFTNPHHLPPTRPAEAARAPASPRPVRSSTPKLPF